MAAEGGVTAAENLQAYQHEGLTFRVCSGSHGKANNGARFLVFREEPCCEAVRALDRVGQVVQIVTLLSRT